MKTKESDSLSYFIILIILLFAGFYYYYESGKRLYKGDIISIELTVSKFKPNRSEYESTDDIEIEFVEFPNNVFKISYLRIEEKRAKEILSYLEVNKKIIIDADRHYYRKKIKQNTFFGIKPAISILGIRQSESEEIPITDYNIEVVFQHLFTSVFAFFGAFIILIIWIFKFFKRRSKVKKP